MIQVIKTLTKCTLLLVLSIYLHPQKKYIYKHILIFSIIGQREATLLQLKMHGVMEITVNMIFFKNCYQKCYVYQLFTIFSVMTITE